MTPNDILILTCICLGVLWSGTMIAVARYRKRALNAEAHAFTADGLRAGAEMARDAARKHLSSLLDEIHSLREFKAKRMEQTQRHAATKRERRKAIRNTPTPSPTTKTKSGRA